MKLPSIANFLKLESAGGIVLMGATALALILENSPLKSAYHLAIDSSWTFAGLTIPSLHWWINDALMVIFFLLVGLEIKRELKRGELSTVQQALLPAVGAIGGMAVPALIYILCNYENPEALRGWAIPAATDIAFSLGVLSLLGSRVPLSLKVFLTALAVIDDLGAILIIAFAYTEQLALPYLFGSVGLLFVLLLCNLRGVRRLSPYLILGVLLWWCVLRSGVHATLAGVCLALLIPLDGESDRSPLERLEHAIHPWVAFGIMPLFALANAGLSFEGIALANLLDGVPIGIALGLFVGKQLGIAGAAFITIKLGLARLPSGSNWAQFYAVCMFAGIGFTMSLFIGTLAFESAFLLAETRLGVFVGSLAAAICGAILFLLRSPKRVIT